MTGRQQVWFAVTIYGPLFVVPLVVWLITSNWVLTAVWTALIWVGLFFVGALIGGAVAFARSRKPLP
jgi:hypothetical protein